MTEEILKMFSFIPVAVQVVILFTLDIAFAVANNVCFKLSAQAKGWSAFVAYQAGGFVTGVICAILITGIYYYVPMHIALPIISGLVMVGIQIFAAGMIFHETIQFHQWAGTVLMIAAVALICYRK